MDSATPELHDLHRGPGTWARTREGIQRARELGFRVRLAATDLWAAGRITGTVDYAEAETPEVRDAVLIPVEKPKA